jgi:hypothetical protein
MDLPEALRNALGDESVAARVPLGDGDLLLVTAARTLVYRGDGLLSDESVEEFPHSAERVEIEEGRRKSTVRLDYGLDGERTLALPTKTLDDAFHPMLAGILNAAGVTDPGEAVKQTFRFSELTVVVTDTRLVKHVGSTVWDADYEEYRYEGVTDLTFEEGSHGTAVVLEQGGRRERFKVPNESARLLRESLVDAVLDYHGHDSLDAFREARAEERAEPAVDAGGSEGEADADVGGSDDATAFGGGLDPLGTGSARGSGADRTVEGVDEVGGEPSASGGAATDAGGERTGNESSGGEPSTATADDAGDGVATEVAALRAEIEAQNERIDRQSELISQLIEELRRGR